MSTKSTLAHGPEFHLYHDLIDRDHVHLEIEGTKVETDYGRTFQREMTYAKDDQA